MPERMSNISCISLRTDTPRAANPLVSGQRIGSDPQNVIDKPDGPNFVASRIVSSVTLPGSSEEHTLSSKKLGGDRSAVGKTAVAVARNYAVGHVSN